MADLRWQGKPGRASLRRALRHRLRHDIPGLRVVAEKFITLSSAIDLLAIGDRGELVSIRIGEAHEDADLLIRALADLTWLRARTTNLIALAPDLGIEAEAEPRAIVVCPAFGAESRAAAENLPNRSLELFQYRCLRHQGQLAILLEPCETSRTCRSPDRNEAAPPTTDSDGPSSEAGLSFSPSPADEILEPSTDDPGRLVSPKRSIFRTGLTEQDLRMEPGDDIAPR